MFVLIVPNKIWLIFYSRAGAMAVAQPLGFDDDDFIRLQL